MRALTLSALFLLAGCAYVASLKHYVAEVLFIIDPQAVKNYMKFNGYGKIKAMKEIRGDGEYFVHEINKFYHSMDKYGLDVDVRASQILVLDNNDVFDYTLTRGAYVDKNKGMAAIKKWIVNNKKLITKPYDVAMVWTGYDIHDDKVAGYASVAAACNSPHNIGFAEFDGTVSTAMTTAHEIGHTLGSHHDGSDTGCPVEGDNGGYLMAPSNNPGNAHKWSFSVCTEKMIVDYIKKLDKQNNDCLLKTTTPKSTFKLSSQNHRDVIDPGAVCKRSMKNKNAFFCQNFYKTSDAQCPVVYCGPNSSGGCQSAVSSDGMKCDNGKRCNEGKCVKAPTSFPTSIREDGCVWGDTKNTHIFNKYASCKDLLAKNGNSQCDSDNVNAMCCETCTKLKSKVKGCKFQDTAGGVFGASSCSAFLASAQDIGFYCDQEALQHKCCEACEKAKSKVKGCSWKDSTNVYGSPSCEAYLKKNGYNQCEDSNVKKMCCEACSKTKSSVSGCKYPDQTASVFQTGLSCAGFIQSKGAGYCKQGVVKEKCCETCKKRETGISGCMYGDQTPDQCKNAYRSSGAALCQSANNRRVCCGTCHNVSAGKRSLDDISNNSDAEWPYTSATVVEENGQWTRSEPSELESLVQEADLLLEDSIVN